MITLYHIDDCPFCWKVRLACHACKIPYQAVLTHRAAKHPDVLRLSPRATVPLMIEDDLILWESAIIVDYLNEQYGQGKLLPGNPANRARLRSLQAYSDTIVGQALRGLIFEKRDKPENDWNHDVITESARRWEANLDTLEGLSPHLDPFNLTVADCALLPRFALAAHYGHGVDEHHPRLLAWFKSACKSPAFQETKPNWRQDI